jgi:ribonucleoside-triphosphate reductase
MQDLPTVYQQQIHKSKYARWIDDLNRREHWRETVTRYMDAMRAQAEKLGSPLSKTEAKELTEGIQRLEVMGSMRATMTAGPALERDNVAGYNCSYLAINRVQAFDEAMYILMCGTGVGFSVERQYVNALPEVPELHQSDNTIVVRDSKIGWSKALRALMSSLYNGDIPKWDVSKVRPSGARLKTFGGRASGPGPLEDLFHYVIETFENAEGRKLTSIECHGIMCKIGDIVVVGGVRRSALISLSNPSDDRMRDAKSGQWWTAHPEYALANNSACWTEKPSTEKFIDEWAALIRSKSGERGIVNRSGLKAQVARNGRRDPDYDFGTNPCSEIILRDREFCNLSEVVARREDTWEDLERKVTLATTLGALQSTFTDFRYLSPQWKKNCEEERLLGVSITGIMDHPTLSGRDGITRLKALLNSLKQRAIETAKKWAKKLGINLAVAITCVKPSGTVSQLVNSASGIHARYADFYIRTNRLSKNDPVAQLLYMQGVPCEDEALHPDSTWVFSYPIKSPDGSVTRHDMNAIEQLELWLVYADEWCEHKPSITVYVRDDEWMEVGAFVYKHFERMSGVSFLPVSDHTYQQAPYQEIDEDEYNRLVAEMPTEIDWSLLEHLETEDQTEGTKELACVAGACEIV